MARICGAALLVAAMLVAPAGGQEVSPEESLKTQADAAYRDRDFTTTIDLTTRVLEKTPNDHVALYLRGSARVEMGIVLNNVESIRKGIADAREAIRHEANGKPEYYLPYIYGMSHLATLENKPVHAGTAITVVDSVLSREDLTAEQRANLYYQRAQSGVRIKQDAQAMGDLQNALQEVPNHIASMMMVAEISSRTKSVDETIAAYTKVVEAYPENPVTYNNRGMYLQSQGRSREALGDFNKAIEIDGKFIPAYINRGFVYLEAGDSASAEIALSQALNVDPKQPGALSLRATARLNQNKTGEALSDYKKVVDIAPTNSLSHADLGFAQFFAGEYAGAVTSFRKALELNKGARFIKPWLLAAEIRSNQYDANAYQDVASLAENERDWVDCLILFQINKLDATSLLKAVHPKDENARQAQLCEGYYFIGMELVRRNRTQDAIAYWQQAVKRKLPKLSAYRGAVFALQNNGQAVR